MAFFDGLVTVVTVVAQKTPACRQVCEGSFASRDWEGAGRT